MKAIGDRFLRCLLVVYLPRWFQMMFSSFIVFGVKHCEKAQATVSPFSLLIISFAAANVSTAQGKGLVGHLLKARKISGSC